MQRLDYFKNIELKISKMNYINFHTCEPGYDIRIAAGVQSSMFFVTEGALTLKLRNSEYVINSGEIFCKDVWQQIEIHNQSDKRVSYFVVTFHFEKGDSFENYGLDKRFSPNATQDFEELFTKLYHCYSDRDIACKIREKAILYEILYKIIRLNFVSEAASKNEMQIALAVRYINQNISKKITLEELSGITNYSIPHLRRLFYEKFKISPLNFITGIRIERAKEIIEIEDLPIAQVSALCGFENSSYFIKQFKKLTGITPKEYKSNHFK